MIESYDFGFMKIDGKIYSKDLIIFPDRIKDNWWRISGHDLSIEDIKEILEEKPEYLVIGTGYSGMMRVSEDVKKEIESYGIKVIIDKTPNAYKIFNELLSKKRKVIGAFHLTC